MKKIVLIAGYWLFILDSSAQTVTQKLQKVFQQFESDSQLKHAISSLYVIDAATGKVVFDKNSQVGLAGASTQKIITAATAFELLGKDYRYKTEFWQTKFKELSDDELICIRPSGDPTFGSPRYMVTKADSFFKKFSEALNKNKIKPQNVHIDYLAQKFDFQNIPDGWIWQDIGNYYGAGAGAFNWKENQSDIVLSSGSLINDFVSVKSIDSLAGTGFIHNRLRTGQKNSGDNAYYYFQYGNYYLSNPLLKGTIPVDEKNFKISITVAHPFTFFTNELGKRKLSDPMFSTIGHSEGMSSWPYKTKDKLIYTHYSPSLDSIIYWFLKKSINLYGEALVKTFAYEKQGFGSTDSGVAIVRKFWKEKGLDDEEFNLYDGSGLSPLNRITSHAQVEILKYAKTKDWFPYFYDALPEYNGMKMKSGTISDVKGFCGYHKSKDGKEYIFSFLVNNYSGKTSGVVNKMYKVLDELK
ncbi:MAG: D-alanyl-D-alanine carboxypeptidase/D-alanyl-D-alanine-endopeptidase [Sphingobacteriales bacterium]|nr:D-alanyl-D-alanine carboxypeptidase/D-alanyl-D-alanine-endopeptidase [Sphingobacteriales bacterium]